MSSFSRRSFILASSSATLLAGCSSPQGSNAAAEIDARVDEARDFLFSNYPGTIVLAEQAAGVLYMPLVTEASFFYGASFGEGALRIKGVSVDYYAVTRASIGVQFGAQQYAHALFFMTPEALATFRHSQGWNAGAGLVYATPDQGGAFTAETTDQEAVVAFIFGQQGLLIGASLAGGKYTRIAP